MSKLVSMEIDFDIYKLVEAERRGFDEPQYLALRRLLKLPEVEGVAKTEQPVSEDGRSWREGLVEVPHGALAKMEYDRGRQVFEGKFLDGRIVVGDKSFDSLSSAASALAVSKRGDSPSLNGWKYWYALLPGEKKWRSLSDMRSEAMGKLKIDL